MNELNTLQRATIDDDTDHALSSGGFAVESSDETVATVAVIGGYWYVVAEAIGVTTVNATRLADGAVGEMEVTVIEAPDPGTFVIKVGAKSPKA